MKTMMTAAVVALSLTACAEIDAELEPEPEWAADQRSVAPAAPQPAAEVCEFSPSGSMHEAMREFVVDGFKAVECAPDCGPEEGSPRVICELEGWYFRCFLQCIPTSQPGAAY